MAAGKKEPGATERKRRTRQAATTKVGGNGRQQVGTEPRQSAPAGAVSGDAFRERQLGEDVELPSGLWCKAKRIGMAALVSGGKIPNSLLPIVIEALEGGDEGVKRAEEKLRKQMSQEHIADMMEMYDSIAMFVVVAPRLRPVPERCFCKSNKFGPDDVRIPKDALSEAFDKEHEHNWRPVPAEEREHGPDIAYIDWIDFADKVYLMNFAVGGTRDLETFRTEQAELLDSLSPGK
jgi:hypothetical protein